MTQNTLGASAGGSPVESKLHLRRAEPADVDLLFEWRNCPDIVARGLTGRTVAREEHQAWFDRELSDPRRLLFVAMFDSVPAGQIRFDPGVDDEWDVSAYLVDPFRGRGLGFLLLQAGCCEAFRSLPARSLTASVVLGNDRSLAAFRTVGFAPTPDVESAGSKAIRLVLHRPPEIPHNRLTVSAGDAESVASVVASGQWTGGAPTRELEAALADRTGVAYAVCVASGSTALRLALAGLGVGTGAEVSVPAYSCVALANAVLGCGATVVPIDVMAGSWNIDDALVQGNELEAAVVIAVHTFGAPSPVGQLSRLGAFVIEDCAHAFGLDGQDGPLGASGAAGTLSFHATKLLGAGEGGAVLTDNPELADYVRDWRDYDEHDPDPRRTNHRMSDLEAALAHSQLRRLTGLLATRRSHAERYSDLLAPAAQSLGLFQLPVEARDRAWYRYVVEVPGRAAEVVEALAGYGVHAARPVTDWRPLTGGAPTADRAYKGLVSLPLYPTLTAEEQDRVVRSFVCAVREFG